jgi:hypothetical protein
VENGRGVDYVVDGLIVIFCWCLSALETPTIDLGEPYTAGLVAIDRVTGCFGIAW